MKKRIVSLLLALVMAVSLLPVSAFAAEVDVPAAQDVPAVEQQNDENTVPDTPATTEEPTGQDAEPATGESQPEEPTNEPSVQADEENTAVGADEIKLVIDLTGYTGTVTGTFKFRTSAFAPVTVEAGKVNEILLTKDTGVGKCTINLDDAPKKFYWSITNAPENCVVDDVETCKTTVYIGSEAVKAAAFFNTKSQTLSFPANIPTGSKFTTYMELWFGRTVTIRPDFDSLDESKTLTPVVTSENVSKGAVTTVFAKNNGSTSSVWTVTATPKDWYKLDYVADEAGNKFVSRDGKTAQITVTAADQKFTAYFTSAVASMYDETNADSVTVNVTLSNDGIPLMGADGTILANLDVTVPYFDLDDYGLGKYYRYGTEFGWGSYNNDTVIERPTALHAYIYIIERYYMGLPASQCGKGTSGILDYKKATDVRYMDGGLAYNSNRTLALMPTGDATSLYMKQFWGHDENLMYFRNHEYPLMGKGWGSTCDYILLSDGDRLDVAMFTNWDFYKDGGFNQFSQDVYSIAQGDTVTTSTFKAGTSAGLDGESPALEPISGLNVAVYDADWNKVADVTGDGTYSYTFDKAGTYYIMATDTGAKTTAAHYAPAIAKVTVTGEPEKNTDEYYLIKNAEDMFWFQQYVNEQGHYDAKAKLAADIDISGLDWQGLGENIKDSTITSGTYDGGYKGTKAFSGEIDGQGHALTVRFTGSPLVNLLSGTVKNLTIKGQSAAGAAFVRYLLTNGHIENCVNYASVSGRVVAGVGIGAFAASACRGNEKAQRKVVVTDCINYGNIQEEADNISGAGGIVGTIHTNNGGIEVTGCKNYGAVSVTTTNAYAGGIIGKSGLSDSQYGVGLTDCENHGTIFAAATKRSGGVYVAGIIAQSFSEQQTISRCLNTGNISSDESKGYVGGITAWTSGTPSLIESCANTGSVAGAQAGGIVAMNYGEITDCYNTGDITGGTSAGGIAGIQLMYQAPNTHYYSTGEVSNCYTTGKVTGSGDNATIGAAVGKLHTGNIVSLEQTTYRDFQVYALEGACAQLVGEKGENAKDATAFKTAAELKSDAMLTTLGDAFKKDAGNINNGYPVLVWQVSEACTDHTPGAAVRENEVPATCTKDGSHDEVIYCTVCKTEISRKTITDKAPGHKEQPAVKENVKDATCTVAGSHDEVVYCSVCQTEISRTTVTDKALGHDWDSTTGKCKRCETACDHKWTNGKCDTCGYTCQHVGGDAVKEKEVPATCTKDGSHDEVVYCTICKSEVSRTNVVDKATGHKWDDGVVTTQPTTGKEGVKTFTCTVCKETKTEAIDKLGEDQKDQSAANEAINLINGIGTVTKNSKDKIDAARKAYDGLTEEQKKLVPDSVLKTLTDAEAAYAKLTKPGTKPGKPSTSTDTKKDDGKTVKSGQTGDAGIVLYAAMGLVALTGGALVLGKKKKQD